MRKSFVPIVTKSSRTETSAAFYCPELSATSHYNLFYSDSNAERSKAMFFLLHGCEQKRSPKCRRGHSKVNGTLLLTRYSLSITIAKPFF